MEIQLNTKVNVDAKFIKVSAGVRYWEDGELNGVDDVTGLMPLRKGDRWEPVICLTTGKIQDWPEGTTASIH